MPRIFDEGKVKEAIKELEKVREKWLEHPEVGAVDVGYKIKEKTCQREDVLAVRVHVRRKRPFEALGEDERFNNRDKQKFLGKFPIDVVEAAYQPNESGGAASEVEGEPGETSRRGKTDPLVGGISISCHRGGFGGTLGAIVFDCTDGQPCILTNWHVLVGSRERGESEREEPIIQPGVRHGGLLKKHKVGKVKRCVLNQYVDAGLAELLTREENEIKPRAYFPDIVGLKPIEGVEEPKLGMEVVKSGCKSGVTKGMIDGISASLKITYDSGKEHVFNDQIRIVPLPPWPERSYEISQPGDSGAIWISQLSGKAIGLHFAGESGSSTDEHAMANRMGRVIEQLNFSFSPCSESSSSAKTHQESY